MSIPLQPTTRRGIESLRLEGEDSNPGRLNIVEVDAPTVLVPYAHPSIAGNGVRAAVVRWAPAARDDVPALSDPNLLQESWRGRFYLSAPGRYAVFVQTISADQPMFFRRHTLPGGAEGALEAELLLQPRPYCNRFIKKAGLTVQAVGQGELLTFAESIEAVRVELTMANTTIAMWVGMSGETGVVNNGLYIPANQSKVILEGNSLPLSQIRGRSAGAGKALVQVTIWNRS